MQGLGNLLARLGGADLDVLARAKQISRPGPSKDQARFVSLGLVLLSTSCIAVLSMAFAVSHGLHFGSLAAVLIGLMWGLIILIVDRALILSLRSRGSKWSLLSMIIPRILMAALLGVVISTPLTLRIFQDEITQQVTVDNIKSAEAASEVIASGDQQKALDALNAEIAKYEGYLAGNVTVTSPAVVAANGEYKRAEADYQAKQTAADKAWAAWRCEIGGQLCEGGSGQMGNGAAAQAFRNDYLSKQADADAAKSLLQEKQGALEKAQAAARDQYPRRRQRPDKYSQIYASSATLCRPRSRTSCKGATGRR
jgi:hypothetical protein